MPITTSQPQLDCGQAGCLSKNDDTDVQVEQRDEHFSILGSHQMLHDESS